VSGPSLSCPQSSTSSNPFPITIQNEIKEMSFKPLTRHRSIVRRASERWLTPATLTLSSRLVGPRLAAAGRSRSANHSAGWVRRLLTHVTMAGPIYRGHSACPVAVAGRRQASGHLLGAGPASLIVVAKASGRTSRSAMAMGNIDTDPPVAGWSTAGGFPCRAAAVLEPSEGPRRHGARAGSAGQTRQPQRFAEEAAQPRRPGAW
jgi:hypothetical protein